MKNCGGAGDTLRQRVLATSKHYQVPTCAYNVITLYNIYFYVCVCVCVVNTLLASSIFVF